MTATPAAQATVSAVICVPQPTPIAGVAGTRAEPRPPGAGDAGLLGRIRDVGADNRLFLLSLAMSAVGAASIILGSSRITPKLPYTRY
ncbi:MAG TPA: hypothetical protein VJB57_03595 [Dehalococcoidia bacterium]|nr:hypothetical protein [Dehalococcoidia bacterium]